MKNPFLTGETIYLRTIEEADLNANYREWFNDEDVCHYNSHHRFPNYDENMRDYYENVIKSHGNLILAICDKEADTHVGNIALENIDTLNRSAEFAILIGNKAHWGKGVGKEAAKLIIGHGFRELNLHRVYCGATEDNIAIRNIALSLGFAEEGISRDVLWKHGTFKNIIRYGVLKDDFKG